MNVQNACQLVSQIVIYSLPLAMVINLAEIAVNAIVCAATGRGFRLRAK